MASLFFVGGGYIAATQFYNNFEVKQNQLSTNVSFTTYNNDNNLYISAVSQTIDRVVEINTTQTITSNPRRSTTIESSGSGVIIQEDGFIITNYHVVENADTILVTLSVKETYKATLIAVDVVNDLALIRIDETNLPTAVFANSDNVLVGELIIAIGNPLGVLSGTVSEGIVSAINRSIETNNTTKTFIQITAAINPGNSGGGLFNLSGNLIGIVSAKSTGLSVEGLGFAIPSNIVLEFLSNHLDIEAI